MMLIHLQSYFRLLRTLIPYWKPVALSLLAMSLAAVAIALVPGLIQHFLNDAFVKKDSASVQIILLTIMALIAIHSTLGFYGLFAISKVSIKLATDLYQDFFNKLLSLPVDTYTQLTQERQVEFQISAIRQITQSTVRLIATSVQDCLIIIGLLISMWYLHQELSLLMLFMTPFTMLVISIVRDYFDVPNQKIASKEKYLSDQLAESIANYRIIKMDAGQICESKRLGKICQSISAAETQKSQTMAAINAIGQMIVAVILCALSYMTVLQVMGGMLGLAELGAMLAAILLLIMPLARLINLPRQLINDHKILEIVFSFSDQMPAQSGDGLSKPRAIGKLVFEQVCFDCSETESATPDLVNLIAKPGDVVVFKGYDVTKRNAVIDSLLRLKSPTHGKILLDDHSIDDIKLDDLYANITLFSAVPALLDEKIAENIAYGAKRCAGEAEITAAARDSHAMTFIRSLPGGLQTRIDAEGVEVSKQQLQFLAIARAYVKNAPILIVEEMPTMQDSETQILLSALQQLMQNRTTLIFCQQIPRLNKIDQLIE